jgi:tRNA pseudouridine38-40 synthase
MRCIRLTLAYDGTNYHGWQSQPGLVTVQGVLEQRLATILRELPRTRGASRTDAGVHARGQVAAVWTEHDIPADRLRAALNSRLPDDIAVLAAADVRPGFQPSADAAGKHYRYRVHLSTTKPVFERHVTWHWYRPLEVEPMREAAAALVGRHDFVSFESRGSAREDTVRTLSRLDVTAAGQEVWFDVEGDGFLYRMVRNLVGTLMEVGRGHRPVAWAAEALAARDRNAAGPCAPPQGLCLMEVRYPPECLAPPAVADADAGGGPGGPPPEDTPALPGGGPPGPPPEDVSAPMGDA